MYVLPLYAIFAFLLDETNAFQNVGYVIYSSFLPHSQYISSLKQKFKTRLSLEHKTDHKATTVNPREYFNEHMVFLTVAILVTNNHCFPLKNIYLLLSNPVHHLVPFAREKQTG